MYYRRAGIVIATLLTCAFSTAFADTLKMPTPPSQGESRAPGQTETILTLRMPSRGLTMHQVEAQFGKPAKKIAPVGDPPISRWVYDEYTVYFEGKYVLHSVLNRKQQ